MKYNDSQESNALTGHISLQASATTKGIFLISPYIFYFHSFYRLQPGDVWVTIMLFSYLSLTQSKCLVSYTFSIFQDSRNILTHHCVVESLGVDLAFLDIGNGTLIPPTILRAKHMQSQSSITREGMDIWKQMAESYSLKRERFHPSQSTIRLDTHITKERHQEKHIPFNTLSGSSTTLALSLLVSIQPSARFVHQRVLLF